MVRIDMRFSHWNNGCRHTGPMNRTIDKSDPHWHHVSCNHCSYSYSVQTEAGVEHEFQNRLTGKEVYTILKELMEGKRKLLKRSKLPWDEASIELAFECGGLWLEIQPDYGDFEYVGSAGELEDGGRRGDYYQWERADENPEKYFTSEELVLLASLCRNAPFVGY